ncbi:hypothetical protein [Streptomyces sp. CBMA156]|uniref:hypothetical protein n=1 Tax=Streptomyces sp. CBMA156 TaxID=1930280 RepID=UPI0016620249|nr:hypothetical protein [Streptomyces sp. CBMA156]
MNRSTRSAPGDGMPNTSDGSGAAVPPHPRSQEWRLVMKMIKSLVRKFKKDEDLANHAWVLHVI